MARDKGALPGGLPMEMFAKLGIPPALLSEARIEHVTDREARDKYGITGSASKNMSGFAFPYLSPVNGYRTTVRIRRDHPEIEDGEPKNKYVTAYGDQRHLYILPACVELLKQTDVIVVLIESEKAALAILAWSWRTGAKVVPIATGGCWGWYGRIGKTEDAQGHRVDVTGALSDLHYCDGRTVYILFDSNVATNPKVRAARNALIAELQKKERGCTVLVCDLPLVDGVNGPDDYVGKCGDDALAEVFRKAHAPTDRSIRGAANKPAAKPADVPPDRMLDVVTLATVAARQPEYMWDPYLPLGALTLGSGDPSSGKSWISLSIAASLSRGELLDGRTVEPQSTLYLTVENPLAEVMRGRFDSLGGDAERLHVLRGYSLIYGDGSKDQCSLTLKDLSMLDEAIRKYKPALVVVDPIQSYLGAEVDAHRSNETRPVLDGLIRLTEKYHLATLIIRHLSKGIGGKALYRGMGSIDLTAAARSEMIVGQLPNDPATRAMVHVKPFTVTGASLGYEITVDGKHGKFKWTGVSNITAQDLLAAPTQPAKLELAKEFLKATLAKGSVEQPKLLAKAENEGISKRTLDRAKKILKVKSTRKSFQGYVLWEFPQPETAPNGAGDTQNGEENP